LQPAKTRPVKRKFKKDHLAWLEPQMDIQCANYEDEVARKNQANPTEGIVQDTQDDLAWSDLCLCGDEDNKDSDWEKNLMSNLLHTRQGTSTQQTL